MRARPERNVPRIASKPPRTRIFPSGADAALTEGSLGATVVRAKKLVSGIITCACTAAGRMAATASGILRNRSGPLLQYAPHPQRLGHAPCLGVATALPMRSIPVENFGNLPEAPLVEQTLHATQIRFRGRDRFLRKIPGARQRLAEDGEGPRPRGAVMIGWLAPRVLVAF